MKKPICQICKRPLKSPESIAAGTGPICGNRGYISRVRSHNPGTSGWVNLAGWETVASPCYSCRHFVLPKNGEEEVKDDRAIVRTQGLMQAFPRSAIGGFCKKLDDLVDGNQIRDQTACMGDLYLPRKCEVEE